MLYVDLVLENNSSSFHEKGPMMESIIFRRQEQMISWGMLIYNFFATDLRHFVWH